MKTLLLFLLLPHMFGAAQAQYVFKEYKLNPSGSSAPNYITELNGKLFFAANDGAHGTELWTSDGTPGGTTLFKDINTGNADGIPANLTMLNNKLYFSAKTPAVGDELWVTDGTPGNTQMLKDIYAGSAGSNPAKEFTYNGKLYFTAEDAVNGTQLFVSDGTAAGTQLLHIFNPNGNSMIYGFAGIGNNVVFLAYTSTEGFEPWVTDGTPAGTKLLRDIKPGTGNSMTEPPVVVYNGKIYFNAVDGIHGGELWVTDGTTAGTQMLKDINPGINSSAPVNMAVFNNRLYFGANDGTGDGMWSTDGTAAGTVKLPLTASLKVQSVPIVCNNRLYFQGANLATGQELWVSDGTAAGTKMVIDIQPGGNSSMPSDLFGYKGKVYFEALYGTTTIIHGLFVTDGTDTGTHRLEPPGTSNVNQMTPGYDFFGFTEYKGSLFFSAKFNNDDAQLWTLTDTTSSATVYAFAERKDILIVPNPSSGNFTIKLPYTFYNTDITVTDMSGRNVYLQHYPSLINNTKIILNDIAQGVYSIQLKTPDLKISNQIVVR